MLPQPRTLLPRTSSLSNQHTKTYRTIRLIDTAGFTDTPGLIDTPGFDDTYITDEEILKRVASWLQSESDLVLVWYFHAS